MRPSPSSQKSPSERAVQDFRSATRRHFSAEEKIRIVLDGLRSEDILAERASIERITIKHRRLQHRKLAAKTSKPR